MPTTDKSKVALIRCESYDNQQVSEAVEEGVRLLGGVSSFVKEGERIVIKPNVLLGNDPDKCICTHPAVFRAVGLMLKKAKVILSYGDSSGFGKVEANMKKARLKEIADELGIALADFDNGQAAVHENPLLVKRFVIAKGVLDADGLVSVSKLKTHGLMRFTGAVKNQFGCVTGLNKSQFHVKLADPFDFAAMLVDLNTLIKPRLYIMDGIIAMEGNGPRSGKPKKLGVLLFSQDPVAMDAIACKIINMNPEFVPTSIAGERAGLGTYHYENIEVMGADIQDFISKDFDIVRKPVMPASSGWIRSFLRNRICANPEIDEILCTKCGTCVEHCPSEPRAVDWQNGDKSRPPAFKPECCVRCYCCQELCPEGAIHLHEPILGRLINR
jgi:uncharacterized protein (DUF362 family)/NAD-dependent dihydropyrimidine dehydrogenase PreA subunit